MKFIQILFRLSISLLIIAPGLLQADDSNIWNRDKLFGDVGGARTTLGERGIAVDVRLNQYYQEVTDGGLREDGEYGGHLDYVVNVDGEKLGLWKGLFLNLHAEYQYGDNILSEAGVFSFNNTAMLYPSAGATSTEVTGWSITQGLYQKGETTIALTAGKIHVGDLINQVWPFLDNGHFGFMNLNVSIPLAPLSRYLLFSHLGTGLMVFHKTDIKAAAIVLDTSDSATTSGFNNLGDNGVIAAGLYRFFFDIKDKPGRLTFLAATSTGSYRTFQKTVYQVSADLPSGTRIFDVPGLKQQPERNPWTALAYYDQIVWQADAEGKRNVRFVAAGAIADSNPSFSKWQYSGQLVATGLFDSRPLDKIGIGGYYTGLPSRVKNLSQNSILLPKLDDYSGFELFYNAALTPAVYLTGDLQITSSPLKRTDSAIIPGVRLTIDF